MTHDPETSEPSFRQPPAEQSLIRVSDADREATVDVIRNAFREGRLTSEETEDRLDRTLVARTQPELDELVRDIVPIQDTHHADADEITLRPDNGARLPTSYISSQVSAILSSKERKGNWVVPAQLTVNAVMGSVKLDLREAFFESSEVVIKLSAVMSDLKIWIPDGAEVVDDCTSIMSDFKVKGIRPAVVGAPRIIVEGFHLMSDIVVRGGNHITLGDRIKGKF
ncbi:hypothetical protein GCM10009785_07130 [Brooklawnia cerclae]|uniref:Cell wall-active antibiotics response LiaF-like C-terminal domain-containing protein n=1 Tax=Brooklawnia cerclae TaxID=349934 RepID=A0ABX0SIR2_9ACTN|nr:DUF1707 domain-containing protein [Brooklawnia cerclae]NIH58292.1 hypothetical protein [Brooklawnia cerclae]